MEIESVNSLFHFSFQITFILFRMGLWMWCDYRGGYLVVNGMWYDYCGGLIVVGDVVTAVGGLKGSCGQAHTQLDYFTGHNKLRAGAITKKIYLLCY